jgi:hypothetical protein
MTNSRKVSMEMAKWLDEIGGEPLAGSGFEDEQPEPGFAELAAGEVGSAGGE